MQIYIFRADVNRFNNFLITDNESSQMIDKCINSHLRNENLSDLWITPNVKFAYKLKSRKMGNFPSLGLCHPVFDKKAKEILFDILEPNGEMLSLNCEGETYYIFNIITVSNALDKETSNIRYWQDGRIERIFEYEFFTEKFGKENIFKLPYRSSYVYVTGDFLRRVQENKLKGAEFTLVWSSDNTGKIGEIIRP